VISFFPLLICASILSLDIHNVRRRRATQAIIVIVYALLGAGYK